MVTKLNRYYEERFCKCADGRKGAISEEELFALPKGENCPTECSNQLCGVDSSTALFVNSWYNPVYRSCSQANIMTADKGQFDKIVLKVGNDSSANVSYKIQVVYFLWVARVWSKNRKESLSANGISKLYIYISGQLSICRSVNL